MARIARVVVRGMPHHITQRGNRRQKVFFGKNDYEKYKELMTEWCALAGVEIWAYCLMTNHIHMVAVPEEADSLARGIGEAHRRYTRMINFRKGWRGYLWQGRFASFPMDDQYLYAAVRYIELNPVRAGLVEDPLDYKWSSARAHATGEQDILLTQTEVLDISNWQEYLQGELSEEEHEAIRKHENTGRPLGSEKFVTKLEKLLGRVLHPQKGGRPRKAEKEKDKKVKKRRKN